MNMKEIESILDSTNFLNAELIQDNKVHFHHNDCIYRVRMPSQKELSDVNRLKNGYYVELLKTPNILSKDNLKKLLKESQGIDIDGMEKELKDLEDSLYKVYLNLAGKRDNDTEGIEKCKKEIEEINNKRYEIIEKIANFLTPSIETQLENFYMEHLTSICTEKIIEEPNKWTKVWNSFDTYHNDSSTLRIYAMNVLMKLMMNVNV